MVQMRMAKHVYPKLCVAPLAFEDTKVVEEHEAQPRLARRAERPITAPQPQNLRILELCRGNVT